MMFLLPLDEFATPLVPLHSFLLIVDCPCCTRMSNVQLEQWVPCQLLDELFEFFVPVTTAGSFFDIPLA
jgi:hypothetical protein